MVRVNLNNTIYSVLADPKERKLYRILNDRKLIGGEELQDKDFINKYIEEHRINAPDSFIYCVILSDDVSNLFVARFISFESHIHKSIWVANNYHKSLGSLNVYTLPVLN